MSPAVFRHLVLDALEPERIGQFWAGVSDLPWSPREHGGGVVGDDASPVLRVVQTSAPKIAKHRVHLDIYARGVGDLEQLGARVVEAQSGTRRWTVMADPEGGEFCAFLREELPEHRLHGLVYDCAATLPLAQWWAGVLGGRATQDNREWATIESVLGTIATMDFCPVPEAKNGRNRLRPVFAADDVDELVAAGAVRVDQPQSVPDDLGVLLADPQGNEFHVVPQAG